MVSHLKTGIVMTTAVAALTTPLVRAQRMTPADAASKITGTWQMNFELSPQFAPRGGGPGGGAPAGRGGSQQYFSTGFNTPSVTARPAFQRGGRGGGGGGGEMSETDRAGNAYIAMLRAAPSTITIKATPESVTFTDPRGERTYAVDNKTARLVVNGATVMTKSRWDNRTLKQEFVFGESRVTHDYELNAEGTRINFKVISQNMSSQGPPSEGKAVYDKKQ
jgi:hypothetical protein